MPGSHEYLLRLLEITAASLHALAGMLYASHHRDTNIRPPEPREGHDYQFRGTDHFYVDFYHTYYKRLNDYPFGLLNVVGYWAEAEILGGVVLFERGQFGSEVQLIAPCYGKNFAKTYQIINAFLQPQAKTHAFQLSQNQLKCFANLSIRGDAAKTVGGDQVLPFAQEPHARKECTFVTDEDEAPLRIYKNEYDKQPVAPAGMNSNCVVKMDSKEGKRGEETMRIIEEKGWNKPPPTPSKLSQDTSSTQGTHQPESSKDRAPPSRTSSSP